MNACPSAPEIPGDGSRATVSAAIVVADDKGNDFFTPVPADGATFVGLPDVAPPA